MILQPKVLEGNSLNYSGVNWCHVVNALHVSHIPIRMNVIIKMDYLVIDTGQINYRKHKSNLLGQHIYLSISLTCRTDLDKNQNWTSNYSQIFSDSFVRLANIDEPVSEVTEKIVHTVFSVCYHPKCNNNRKKKLFWLTYMRLHHSYLRWL